MKRIGSIITVGLCPTWDMVCEFDGIDWGDHKLVSASSVRPAGKAMNMSRALAWMGQKNIAAGLWGEDDYELLLRAMKPLRNLIAVKVTPVAGSTRRNVTVVDTKNHREMHLRHWCKLASKKAMQKLRSDLAGVVKGNSVCVFSGLMPGDEYLDDIVVMIEECAGRGARIVVDTWGEALRRILDTSKVWMIKPNVEELRGLLGTDVADRPPSLAKAARGLLDKVETVLISRGAKGAVVVTRDGAWQGRCVGKHKVLSTVGCGDYMLAGFLKGYRDSSDVTVALETSIKAGTAKAWGRSDDAPWEQVEKRIVVESARV